MIIAEPCCDAWTANHAIGATNAITRHCKPIVTVTRCGLSDKLIVDTEIIDATKLYGDKDSKAALASVAAMCIKDGETYCVDEMVAIDKLDFDTDPAGFLTALCKTNCYMKYMVGSAHTNTWHIHLPQRT